MSLFIFITRILSLQNDIDAILSRFFLMFSAAWSLLVKWMGAEDKMMS